MVEHEPDAVFGERRDDDLRDSSTVDPAMTQSGANVWVPSSGSATVEPTIRVLTYSPRSMTA